jgi:beta-glucoside PTS system EIICBA component
MDTTTRFDRLATEVVDAVGGAGNIHSVTNCMTRLRFVLNDRQRADKDAVEKIDGVVTVVEGGGQFQVVIGNDVVKVAEALDKLTDARSETAPLPAAPAASRNIFNRVVELISSIFQPILWVLAGTGLLKGILFALAALGWLPQDSQTSVILNAGADAVFYFLPMFLAITSARRFGASPFTALTLAGALIYPAITALAAADSVHFLGIPVIMTTYTSSVIPIIVIVWVQSHYEKLLGRILQSSIRNFMTPLIVVATLFPLALLTIGPATTWLSAALSAGLAQLWSFSPALAGFIVGGLQQLIVVLGLHWGLIALMINDVATTGHTLLLAPFPAAVMAQGGAALAVFLRTRSRRLKAVAGPATVSGLVAGVTEPILYGVTLPLKRPFVFASIAGALGGGLAAWGGSAAGAVVAPSFMTLPVYLNYGNFALQVIGTVGATVLAFLLTLVFGFKDPIDDDSAGVGAPDAKASASVPLAPVSAGGLRRTEARSAGSTAFIDIASPVDGEAIDLDDVAEPAFSSGAIGPGAAVRPASDRIVSPARGQIVSVMPHAFGVITDEGVEVLVHVGIDTVRLEGRHFHAAVAAGDRVEVGQLLTTADIAAIEAAGYDTTTLVVITNEADPTNVEAAGRGVVAASTPLFRVRA